MVTYETITETIDALNKNGFTIDFNLGFDGAQSLQPTQSTIQQASDKFLIIEVHRFEGNTDPDDEAVVYAIESRDGGKGIFVNGYGVSSDSTYDGMIRNIAI